MNQEVRCLTVAQELGYCQRMDKPFAGTPPLIAVRLILHHAAKESTSTVSWSWT